MANLDQAATQALDDVNALVSELDQTEEQIDDLHEQLADAKQRLEEDWSDLHEQLEEVLATADAQEHMVRDGATAVDAAVGHLKTTAEPLAGEIEVLLERAKAELAEFGHWCEERNAELTAKAEQLTAATETAQHAAEESERLIAEAGEEARALLEGFGLQLRSFEGGTGSEQVTPVERYRMLREAHLERIQPQIEEQVRGLLEEIGDAREALQAGLEESNQLAEDAIDVGETEMQDQHQKFLDELKQKADAAREAILALTQEVEQQGDQVEQDAEATAGHSDQLHERLSGASETVSEVLELLSRVSFVRFLRG